MVEVPVPTPVTSPPGEVTVATEGDALVQPTCSPWTVFCVPFENRAVAVIWTVLPMETVAEGGLMNSELTVGWTKNPPQPATVKQATRAKVVLRAFKILAVEDDLVSLVCISLEVNHSKH